MQSGAPNVYHDLVAPDRTGFHLVGVWADQYHRDKERLVEQLELAMDMGTQTRDPH